MVDTASDQSINYEASSIDVPVPPSDDDDEPVIDIEPEIKSPSSVQIVDLGEVNLHISSMESFYIMNELAIGHYAGDMQKCYLRFDKQDNKLLDVIYDVKKGGKIEINPRYDEHRDELWLIESKLGSRIYGEMAKNRAAGKGTVLYITAKSKDRMISEIKCEAVNVVNL